jgi:hypothetical protein
MRIFFGCIDSPAGATVPERSAPGKFHIGSLQRIDRPIASLTATGKKPWKSCEKAEDRPSEMAQDWRPQVFQQAMRNAAIDKRLSVREDQSQAASRDALTARSDPN